MFVTNLTTSRLGVNGVINLAPNEANRYINDKDADLVKRVEVLKAHGLVSVVYESGLTKTGISGKVVKTIGVDTAALSTAPRTKVAEEATEETTTKKTSRRGKKAATTTVAE